jgi:hypothetical protein
MVYNTEQRRRRTSMSEPKPDEVPWWRNHPWLGGHLFLENRNKNCHLLLQYQDMYVAWFPDGSGIRDADADLVAMQERIEAAGEDPSWYCYEYAEPHG